MCMCDKDFFDLAHLQHTLLKLVLGGFTAVKEPDIAPQSEGKRRVVSRRGRLSRGRSQKCDSQRTVKQRALEGHD